MVAKLAIFCKGSNHCRTCKGSNHCRTDYFMDGGLIRYYMAKLAVRVVDTEWNGSSQPPLLGVVEPKYSSRIRSYVEFEGNVENMHIEINTGLRTLALVAPIRLNATRELLDRVQGHIPEDYYSRFDRYRKGWAHDNLVDEAEKGPICANEFGFTKALANCNDLERHYYADQNYHLLMRPYAGFDCINSTKVEKFNGTMGKRESCEGDMYLSYADRDVWASGSVRLAWHGFQNFNFRQYDWPNGRVKGRGPLEQMPLVRYTSRPRGLDAKTRISPKLKRQLQHAINLHNAAENLLRNGRAPFGEYWAIGAKRNYTATEVF